MAKTIAKLTVNDEWIKLGELNQARQGHAVIFAQGAFLVTGGLFNASNFSFNTEHCLVEDGTNSIECVTQEPVLELYGFYPEMFLVPANYCKTMH